MERTELRDQFFAEAKRDPWTHAVAHHVANAWALGYEQALRDHGLTEPRLRQTHGDRVEMAFEWMTDQRSGRVAMVVALAHLGKLSGWGGLDKP